jgi:hypothetical protein
MGYDMPDESEYPSTSDAMFHRLWVALEEYAKVLKVVCSREVGSHGIGRHHNESWRHMAITTLAATRWKRLETTLRRSKSLPGHLWQMILLYTRRISFILRYSVHCHVNGNSGRRSGECLDRLCNMYNVLRPSHHPESSPSLWQRWSTFHRPDFATTRLPPRALSCTFA